jgi:hypothetical protein
MEIGDSFLTGAPDATDFIAGKTVVNFAALPAVGVSTGLLAIVLNAQGVWPITYKAKGLYYCDGATWAYQGDYYLTDSADEIAFTPSGGITSDNVQDAIVEVAGLTGTAWGDIVGTLSDQTDLQTALDGKVDENVAITGSTKTKITYDAKGLVTGGADATTADIADSANKRYVTDAQLVVIGNTSGTNTGDQTSIVGITGTKAEFNTACTDGNFLFVGDVTSSNSVSVSCDFGVSFTDKAQTVVTGQTWVAADSEIVAHVKTGSSVDPDEMYLLNLRTVISDLVAGDGFTLTLYSEPEAKGTYSVMCIGV